MRATYIFAGVLGYPIGMVFGQSFSLLYVEPLRLIYSSWPIKIVRTFIGCVWTIGVTCLFIFIYSRSYGMLPRFVWAMFLPFFLNSFFIFGLWPFICSKVGLINRESQ